MLQEHSTTDVSFLKQVRVFNLWRIWWYCIVYSPQRSTWLSSCLQVILRIAKHGIYCVFIYILKKFKMIKSHANTRVTVLTLCSCVCMCMYMCVCVCVNLRVNLLILFRVYIYDKMHEPTRLVFLGFQLAEFDINLSIEGHRSFHAHSVVRSQSVNCLHTICTWWQFNYAFYIKHT